MRKEQREYRSKQQMASDIAAEHLSFDSEHCLRAENLCWDIDVWYPLVEDMTFKSVFVPLTMTEAKAIQAFHDVSWRKSRENLSEDEIDVLRELEQSIDNTIQTTFGNAGCFIRLCGRSPKDGEPLHRDAIFERFQREHQRLIAEGRPDDIHTKMTAIARTPLLHVRTGAEVMSLLLTSERIYADILDWIRFGEPEQICLREFSEEISVDYEFRVFVSGGHITAITQYDHYAYYPHLHPMKHFLQSHILIYWKELHSRIGLDQYIVDIAYLPISKRFICVEFSPFFPCTGASLFNWTQDIDVLTGKKPFEFRMRHECDVHPQLADLMEVNWDGRWKTPMTPYSQFLSTSRSKSLVDRMKSVFRDSFQNNACDTSILFVYGTLKRGFQWHSKYLSPKLGAKYVSPATTTESYPLVIGECGVPYLLGDMCGCGEKVRGEVYRVTPECLQNLDDYEGVSKEYYLRRKITIETDGKQLQAYIYYISNPPEDIRHLPMLCEYTLEMHRNNYHPIKHIHIKQKNYFKTPSTWGRFVGNIEYFAEKSS